jgi:hypothetical protein
MFSQFTFRSKLDRAIAFSIVAMLGFNLVVLSQQLQGAPVLALQAPAAAQQA